ncbi:DUF779 domain-containing protein [Brachyspira sp.]|uniref:DUF779 domain-containing protein n=1 Tax=Brachyspira sp. TaxID=1977261 RepID=UPI002617AF93|nr:DUF779 domain-containing protein [Brachyspira sp.]
MSDNINDNKIKIIADDNTVELIKELKEENGNIIFHISCGCCDGTMLLCSEENDFKIGENDILLGAIENTKIYTHQNNYVNFENSTIYIKTLNGNGSEFSLEYGSGKKFVLETQIK